MKITYGQAVELWFAERTDTGSQMIAELAAAEGMPMDARVRIMSIIEVLSKQVQRFAELRDAACAREKVEVKNGKFVPMEDSDEDDGDERVAKVTREVGELLALKTDAIQPIKASMLSRATGAALSLLSAPVLFWLSPILQDDL